ncbi:hypothetical protein B0A55_07439 [Friedmanniomyces simplex]|uniref:Uncharacterized protein n=1 Tax=Friedmanniomyces simplex TaxID=329884 RepID=A0A4U0WWN9_9PEZI|nr:hypothetical protein B0A55_07439 [Friedmanniomyces simplex]
MAATLSPGYSLQQPRSSTDTDRRHLLSDSVAPSSAASIITETDGDRTPRAHSPAPSSLHSTTADSTTNNRFRIPASTTGQPQQQPRRDTITDPTPQPYRGFPSEAHYLAALHAWADQQKYIEPGTTALYGFYGHQSLQDYASKPPMEIGIRRKWRARREAKREGKMIVNGQGREGEEDQGWRKKIGAGRRNTVT